MDRKIYPMAFVAALSSCQLADNAALAGNPPAGRERPNILYIMSDDHCSQTIGVYASVLKDIVRTPNIDRIGREGVIMRNCFATNSISTPSRAAILTGQYSHHNGVYTLLDELPAGSDNMAKHLQEAGYRTAVIGKWHLGTMPEGFDTYSILPGQGKYNDPVFLEGTDGQDAPVKKVEKGYCTDIITDKSIAWMGSQVKGGEPFFLMCHFKAPHTPFTPAPRHEGMYDGTVFPEPENLYDDYSGREAARLATCKIENTLKGADKTRPVDKRRAEAYQSYMRRYLSCVAAVDENVGRMLDWLEENGELDNTVVIYTSDQGFFVGEHGFVDKRFMYEESIRMPLLIRWPGVVSPGSECDDIVLNVDFAPTLLDAAGCAAPSSMDGRSFLHAIDGSGSHEGRDAFYYRYWMDVKGYRIPAHYGIRTDRYKLIYFYGHQNLTDFVPQWELYDLKSDPSEMDNLYGRKQYRAVTDSLKNELSRLRSELGDTE